MKIQRFNTKNWVWKFERKEENLVQDNKDEGIRLLTSVPACLLNGSFVRSVESLWSSIMCINLNNKRTTARLLIPFHSIHCAINKSTTLQTKQMWTKRALYGGQNDCAQRRLSEEILNHWVNSPSLSRFGLHLLDNLCHYLGEAKAKGKAESSHERVWVYVWMNESLSEVLCDKTPSPTTH